MSLTIALSPETESRLRAEAVREQRSLEEVAARRVEEAELLRRIFAYFPDAETREVRRLIRKRDAGVSDASEAVHLQTLIERREERNAERLSDLVRLASLRSVPLRQLMAELRIRPMRVSPG